MKWLVPRITFAPSGISRRTEVICTMPIIVSVQRLAGPLTEDALLAHMSRLPKGRAAFKRRARELGLKGDTRSELDQVLERLANRGELIEGRSGQYEVARTSREYVVGRLNMHRDGYGFVVASYPVEWMKGDLFIPREAAEKAMHGDRVLARVLRVEANGRADGEIVRILKRAHVTVVGEFNVGRHGCYVKPHDERIQQWIDIPEGMEIPESGKTVHRVGVEPVQIGGVEELDGMIVNVEIVEWPQKGDNPVGRVIEVLGSPDDFGVDVEIIIRKHHIPHRFPDKVLQQAQSYPMTI